jgi:hypothetical protein
MPAVTPPVIPATVAAPMPIVTVAALVLIPIVAAVAIVLRPVVIAFTLPLVKALVSFMLVFALLVFLILPFITAMVAVFNVVPPVPALMVAVLPAFILVILRQQPPGENIGCARSQALPQNSGDGREGHSEQRAG